MSAPSSFFIPPYFSPLSSVDYKKVAVGLNRRVTKGLEVDGATGGLVK